jgi:hypothetical protein
MMAGSWTSVQIAGRYVSRQTQPLFATGPAPGPCAPNGQ